MTIFDWNVSRDITIEKYNHIKEFSADIFIIQECLPSTFENFKSDWKYSFFHSDTLYEADKGGYGIAIFSNNCKINLTPVFNKSFRYVIPIEIEQLNIKFYLFAIWTKAIPIKYYKNVLEALVFPGYQNYISGEAVFVGDFNTPTTKENHKNYDSIISAGLIDCASKNDILKRTYSHSKDLLFYTADYCLATKKMLDNYIIKETILDFDLNINSKLKYNNMSDHVPLIIQIEPKGD